MILTITSKTVEDTLAIGAALGQVLKGGELIELTSDVGGGKTTFTKGLGYGLGCRDTIQSPSFTISRVYDCDRDLQLHHFDFYRLQDAGIMAVELAECISDPQAIVVVEWAGIVDMVLPTKRIRISINAVSETNRVFTITIPRGAVDYIADALTSFTKLEQAA